MIAACGKRDARRASIPILLLPVGVGGLVEHGTDQVIDGVGLGHACQTECKDLFSGLGRGLDGNIQDVALWREEHPLFQLLVRELIRGGTGPPR